MKRFLFAIGMVSTLPAFADTVITFKDGVLAIPAEVRSAFSSSEFEVKKAWTTPRFTLQNLPQDPWAKAKRHPNLAVLVRGEMTATRFDHKAILRVEENLPYSEEESLLDEPPFDPVKCDGIIYGFLSYSKADQKLETSQSCDNYAIRPAGDAIYNITISSPTKKTVEIYEHGSLVASGSGLVKADFTFGYRQRYIIVRGEPGPYHIEIYPEGSNTKKDKLSSWILNDLYSNVYGYGIPAADILTNSAPQSSSKWVGARMMGVESLWEKGITGKGVKVAVIDTGADTNHPFLKDAVAGGFSALTKGTNPADYQDEDGHGSHVAGVIHQVAPDAQIYAIRVFGSDGGATLEDVTAGIQWAIAQGVQVVNMSLGGTEAPRNWPALFSNGVNKGVFFVAASGNNASYDPLTPAAYAGTVSGFGFSVGAADQLMNMAVFSNWTGNDQNIKFVSSHGKKVLSVAAGTDAYVNMSGTSMASPQIAGYMALLKQAYPGKSNAELIAIASKYVRRPSVND